MGKTLRISKSFREENEYMQSLDKILRIHENPCSEVMMLGPTIVTRTTKIFFAF